MSHFHTIATELPVTNQIMKRAMAGQAEGEGRMKLPLCCHGEIPEGKTEEDISPEHGLCVEAGIRRVCIELEETF